MSTNVKNKYDRREKKYGAFLEKINNRIKKLVLYKLLVIFGGLGLTISVFAFRYYYLGFGALITVLILYPFLNSEHDRCIYYQTLAKNLIVINQNSIKRLNGGWTSFEDNGGDLDETGHFYAGDLDIVGQGSVFQLINCCTTPWGRSGLKSLLFNHPENVGEILERQQSVVELAENLPFRQRLQAEGITVKEDKAGIDLILQWGRTLNEKLLNRHTILFFRLLPMVTFTFAILGYFGLIPVILPVLFTVAQIGLLIWKSRERSLVLNTAYAFRHHLEPYQKMMRQLERKAFSSPLLHSLKEKLYTYRTPPSAHLHKLSRICGNISNRNNMFYFIFNIITLWDYQCEIQLEKWKQQCGSRLSDWFETLGAVEALSSLSVLNHDNPGWVIPEITESDTLFVKAEQTGHPLITVGRVANNIEIGGKQRVILITGSNMSGKSTLLRTIGLNLVLAYAGSAVCAESFSCARMNVYSCMRVSDNLEKNISGFYAELLRIKMIVEAVKSQERVFFLLDEIFKGTNSYDRHYAARILIAKLAGDNCIGLVSTHDLELEVLEKETTGQVVNYHFQEYYEQGRIIFDYRLQPGVSRTRNAVFLIKALGIDLD